MRIKYGVAVGRTSLIYIPRVLKVREVCGEKSEMQFGFMRVQPRDRVTFGLNIFVELASDVLVKAT